jgi:hypothetical protein
MVLILPQAFSQKGVQASWDAPRTKSGRPNSEGKRKIIFNYCPKYINMLQFSLLLYELASILIIIIHLTF